MLKRKLKLGFAIVLAAFSVQMASVAHADTPLLTVAFAQDNMSKKWRYEQVMAVKSVLDQYPNINFIYADGRGDPAQHIGHIQDMVRRGVDLLIISPCDGDTMTPIIAQVRAQNIPVVLLTRRISTNDYTTFVSPKDDRIAQRAAAYMAHKMNASGKILVLQGVPKTSTAILRTQGFLDEIAKHHYIQVVAIRPANEDRLEAQKVVENAMMEGLEFDAIYAQNGHMASGARDALKAAGIDPRSKLIVGIDYIPETREAIRAGEQSASFTYPTSGREGAELAVRILMGETVAREVEVPSTIVTSANVEDVETVF